jgi:CheY-like chemotaxis protein
VEVLTEAARRPSETDWHVRLQASLRELYYPDAAVSPRTPVAAGASDDEATWYVFRDGSVPPTTTGQRRFLIVDDDEAFVEMLEGMLRQAGFATQRALDGLQALDAAAVFAPSVILLDLAMPKATGEEFARMYEREPSPRAHIVVVSGRSDAHTRALDLGARAVIPKPFELEPLLDVIRQYA